MKKSIIFIIAVILISTGLISSNTVFAIGTPTISLIEKTDTSLTYKVTYPEQNVYGNRLELYDLTNDEWRQIAPDFYLNDGTYTFFNLAPGTDYRASLTWYDTKWTDTYCYSTTNLYSPSLCLEKVTDTSISIKVQYPYPSTWGNHLEIYDSSTGKWSNFNGQAADAAPYRTNGIYTQTGLQKGANYKIYMRWYDTIKESYEDLPILDVVGLTVELNQVECLPANKNAVISLSSNNSTVLQKWAKGNHDISYFHKKGNSFTADTFEVFENDEYTIYAKDIYGNETCEKIEIQNVLPRVLVLVENSIYNDIENSLATYKSDLLEQGYYAVIEPYKNNIHSSSIPSYSGNGNVDLLKELIKSRYTSWSNPNSRLKGFVLVGSLPYAKVSKEETAIEPLSQYCMSDWYLNDMNGIWTDSNNNGILDKIKGNMKPELWSGRIYSDSDNANISQYKSYFKRNHLYRTGALSHSDKACYLGTFDDTLVNRNALKALYSKNNTTILENGDPIACINDDYEWFDYIEHSNPWSLGNINYNDIKTSNPNILFYNTHACSTARYEEKDYIAGKILFETTALEYIGATCDCHYFPDQDAAFKTSLKNGKTFGEAHKNLLSTRGNKFYNKATSIDIYLGQELNLFGDPTLKLLD